MGTKKSHAPTWPRSPMDENEVGVKAGRKKVVPLRAAGNTAPNPDQNGLILNPIPPLDLPGHDVIAAAATRVLPHAEDFAKPGLHGIVINDLALARSVITVTGARWRHDQPWMFTGTHYQPGEHWIHPLGLVVGEAVGVKNPLTTADRLVKTVNSLLRAAPQNAEFDRRYWDAAPVIPLQNGTLDLTDPSQPAWLPATWRVADRCTWRCHATWDPTADESFVHEFLETSIPDPGQRQMLLEYLGYILAHWDLGYQSYLFLLGMGSNGKGVLLTVIRALLQGHYESVSLSDLAGNRFAVARTVDAVANLVGDESAGFLKDGSVLKQATGGDAMSAERKHKDAYAAVPKAKYVFALNQLPRINDYSHGFFRRPIVVDFPKMFPKDPAVEKRLTTANALSTWVRLAVGAYGALRERGDFDRRHTAGSLAGWRSDNDLVSAAMAEGFFRFDADGTIPADLYSEEIRLIGKLLGMEPPRRAETIRRLQQAAVAEQTGITVKLGQRHDGARVVTGITWGPGIWRTRYRASIRDEYQTLDEWLALGPEPEAPRPSSPPSTAAEEPPLTAMVSS